MLKLTGNAKIVDIGAAFPLDSPPPYHLCTPRYAAPEILENDSYTPRGDLASLGYVLVEMLSGEPLFSGINSRKSYLEAKRALPHQLDRLLPQEVTCSDLLMNLCRRLIAPDPRRRFPSAEEADLQQQGAAAFHRQLVLTDLASEYDNEIRLWLKRLKELDLPDA